MNPRLYLIGQALNGALSSSDVPSHHEAIINMADQVLAEMQRTCEHSYKITLNWAVCSKCDYVPTKEEVNSGKD